MDTKTTEEFESWMETFEVMKDFPDLKADIKAAERDYERGNYVTLEEILAQENFASAKPIGAKKKHDIPSCRVRKSTKRT